MAKQQSPRWTYNIDDDGVIGGVPELFMLGFDETRTALPLAYHDHKGYEFVLVERGRASWELNSGVYETRAGDVFHTIPGEFHRGGFNVIEPSRFWWVIIMPPHSENWLRLPPEECEAMKAALQNLPRVIHTGLLPVEAFQMLRMALFSTGPLQPTAIRQSLLGLLLRFLQPHQQMPSMAEDLRRQLDALLQRMDAEPEWRPAISEMADFVRISPSHFFRTFQEYMGLTPMAYMERSRVKKACSRLVETADSITNISGELGYASSQHFATVFKRITGTTPMQWRNNQFDRTTPL